MLSREKNFARNISKAEFYALVNREIICNHDKNIFGPCKQVYLDISRFELFSEARVHYYN